MKIKFKKHVLLVALMPFISIISCQKDSQEQESNDPVVQTNVITDITQTSATCGGTVTYKDAASIFYRGVCWNTTGNPTFIDSRTSETGGTGAFTSAITGLMAGTTYYVRAYAQGYIGYYGPQVSFTTAGASVPTLATAEVTSITKTTAISGGTIINDGGTTVTARGICWSTQANPTTLLNTKTSETVTTADFASNITGLSLGVTYHVRAYATNNAGTAYGNDISFIATEGVGDNFQGGIIAYLFESGDAGYLSGEKHGLIAAPSDQGVNIRWYNGINITTGATGTAIGTGNMNTIAIVSNQGSGNYAAKLCSDLVLGGYSDWFLPSKDELDKVNLNQALIGGFANDIYWSSSEDAIDTAWMQQFNSTATPQTNYYKNIPNSVRGVRKF